MKKKMLVIRFSAIGDVAMSVHAVRALRKAYPSLSITVATRDRLCGFFDGVQDIDFLPIPAKAGKAELREFIRKARQERFDYVADIHNTLRGRVIRMALSLSGAKTAAFRQMRWGRFRIKRRFCKNLSPLRNHVLRFCDVFARLGYPVPEPVIVREIRSIPEAFGEKNGSWAGIAPFARKKKKIYPQELCEQLIGKMAGRFDRLFVFSGPGAESAFAKKMAELYDNVVPVFGKTDMSGEVALISNLDLLVTMDSAAMHMAALTGAPFIALWGGTHPSIGYSAYGAVPERNYVQLDMPCRPCSVYGEGKCRLGNYRCLSEITPEMVMEKAESLIAEREAFRP